jgi:hypothetical protein
VHGNDFPGQLSVPDTIKELSIDYPVAHDEDKATWRSFGIRFRPSYVLIGPDGAVAGQGVGLVTTDQVKERVEAVLPR